MAVVNFNTPGMAAHLNWAMREFACAAKCDNAPEGMIGVVADGQVIYVPKSAKAVGEAKIVKRDGYLPYLGPEL